MNNLKPSFAKIISYKLTKKPLAVCFFLILGITNAHGQSVYQWEDAEGNIHFSQQPPAINSIDSENTKKIDIKTPAASSTPVQPVQNKQPSKPEDRRKQDCENTRNNLALIKSSANLQSKDKDGNVRSITPEEIQQSKEKNEKFLKEHCKFKRHDPKKINRVK